MHLKHHSVVSYSETDAVVFFAAEKDFKCSPESEQWLLVH